MDWESQREGSPALGNSKEESDRADGLGFQSGRQRLKLCLARAGRRVEADLGREFSMRESFRSWIHPLIIALVCVMIPCAALAADDSQLTKEQIKVFLLTAPVIKDKPSSKGITHPWHLTLSDGTTTHDASFQSVDEHKSQMKMESGNVEIGFVDSYKYNIAAYQVAELLGVDDMLPVYVERKWQGKTGSISWWL